MRKGCDFDCSPQVVALWLQRIVKILQQWQQALQTATHDIPALDLDEKTTPDHTVTRINAALAAHDWEPLAIDLTQGFPLNLLDKNLPVLGP
ncbi:MAG: hypothetical protein H6974_11615 [Gammaproteobacteria bacterium]|nr:hypothetical protein [Gammaproteobacteria bacterium]